MQISKILKRGIFIVMCAMLLAACNKNNEVSTDDETTAASSDDTTSDNQNDEVNSDEGNSEDVNSDEDNKNTEENIIVRPVAKDYIQSAIDYANKIGGEGLYIDDAGNVYVPYDSSLRTGTDSESLSLLYSCYGKDIKQVRQYDKELLILTNNGDVYHNTQLIIQDENVTDMLWTLEYDLAYCMYGDGKIMAYWNDYKIPTECKNDKRLANMFCGYNGLLNWTNAENDNVVLAYPWKDLDTTDWKNLVVMACMTNIDTDKSCIAGISADGKVYAAGDFADEILSWGKLAYITMDENLIIGMKKDGTLAFAGEDAIYYQDKDIPPVKGIRLWNGTLYAITENGTIHGYRLKDEKEAKIVYRSFEHRSGLKMDTDGNIYRGVKKGDTYNWELSEYIQADKDKAFELIYYQTLLSWSQEKTTLWELKSFLVQDFNNDGRVDVMCKVIHDNEETLELYENEGRLVGRDVLGNQVASFYPNSGVIVWRKSEFGDMSAYYVDMINEVYFGKVNLGRGSSEYFLYGKLVTEDVFDEEFERIINGDEGYEIVDSMFLEATEENLRNAFLK